MPFKKIFFILLAALGVALLWSLTWKFFPFTSDSLLYITTAEHIHRGQGLICSNFLVSSAPKDFVFTYFHPPGYPILISFFIFIGLDAYTSGLLVPYSCFLVLPLLFYLIFKRLVPKPQAMIGAFLSTFMFITVKCALYALSDVPCLCFSLLALLTAFRAIEKGLKASSFLVFLAGILAGGVFLIRYVGMVLIVSIGLGFIACWILKMISKKDLLKIISIFTAASGIVIAPFLYRNWYIYGNIFCFHAASSLQIPWGDSIKSYLSNIAYMFWAKPSMLAIVALFIISTVIFIVIRSKKMIEADKKAFVFMIVLTTYFLIYSLTFIIFAKNEGFFEIEDRFFIQIVWILMIAVVMAMDIGIDLIRKIGNPKKVTITGALLMAFVIIQITQAKDFLKSQENLMSISRTIQQHVPVLLKIPKDFVIITNLADLVYYHIRRPVYRLNNYSPNELAKFLYLKKKFVVFLVNDAWRPQLNIWGSYGLEWLRPEGYSRLFSDKHVDIFVPNYLTPL